MAAGASAAAPSADGFVLSAGFADLPTYFPAYLANGYFSTLSTPRGTEPAPSYVVGLMDYAPGDISRPAAIPGWSEIDFSATAAGRTWMNRVPFDEHHFQNYQQSLNLREAALTTRYHYLDGQNGTAIEVTTLISKASPHLAASRFSITPDYSGMVHVSFPLTLWAEHAPRLPLARLNGPATEDALTAYGLSVKAHPPSTSDRTALWYPGYVQLHGVHSSRGSLSLWLDGRALRGLPMAMAVTVGLPEGTRVQKVSVQRSRYRQGLDVLFKAERGHTYTFTKYIAVSRSGWGGHARADLALAQTARKRGFERLLADQRSAWEALWQPDIVIDGDVRAQTVTHAELYALLSTLAPGTSWGTGPCGLTLCYAGHAFWDSDTWMLPALLLLHPEYAKPIADFRARTLQAARARARRHHFAGAMFPWESDPQNGSDQTPRSAAVLADSEIHVNADVAIAQWQYYLATQDRQWLSRRGWPVIREVARFWTSRARYNAGAHRYDIPNVTSVAESVNAIPNDTFTNASAAAALNIAAAAAKVLGQTPDPRWQRMATQLYVPMTPDGAHHLAFDPAAANAGSQDAAPGPLMLLFLPSLDLTMSDALRRGDYAYVVPPGQGARTAASSMRILPRSTAAAVAGQAEDAGAWFAANFTGGTLKGPYAVRTESASNYTGYFLTGSGGYLQNLIYGFTGLRIREAGLAEAYPPVLTQGWKSLTLRGVSFRGQRLDIAVTRDASGKVQLTRRELGDAPAPPAKAAVPARRGHKRPAAGRSS